MRILAAILVILACVYTSKVRAQEVKVEVIGVHIGSQHFPAQDYNNFNPGVYVQADVKEVPLVAGAYYNSERRPTAYLGYNWSATSWLDVTIGGATGYRWAVTPAIIPSVHFPVWDNIHARVAFIPKFEKSGSTVVHLAVEWRFK